MVATLAELLGTVSPSKLETAQRCLAQFLFRYVERLPRNYRADGQLGNAIDATGNHVYEHKLQTGTTLPRTDVAEFFAAAWDYESQAIADWQGEKRGEVLDRGVAMVGRWREDVAQWVGPRTVQQRLRTTLTDPTTRERFDLIGVVDVTGSTAVPLAIADLKKSGRSYSIDRITRSLQPVAYTLLAGIPTFEFHVLVETKQPRVQVLRATLPDGERDAFVKRAGMLRRQVAHAFTTGDWLPNRTHTLCSRRYCEFWRTCERRFGGQVPQ